MLAMKSIGFVTSIKKKKVKVSEYMPNSKYIKLWFYLGMYLYTMSVRNALALASQTSLKTSFLSIQLGRQLTLSS